MGGMLGGRKCCAVMFEKGGQIVTDYDAPIGSKKKSSLRGQVFQKIRNDILSGKYQQKEELIESTLGARLGVSRTPVREALRQLELEGLVEIIPNKGAFVTGITPKDIRDIYSIRAKLEGLCARWAAQSVTEELLERMEETAFLSEYHAERLHYEQVFELDGRFHEMLYEASGSRILAHTLSDYHQYVQKVRRASVADRIRSQKCNEEHHKILDAIRQGDENRAEEVATQHILNTIENLGHFNLEELLRIEE